MLRNFFQNKMLSLMKNIFNYFSVSIKMQKIYQIKAKKSKSIMMIFGGQ